MAALSENIGTAFANNPEGTKRKLAAEIGSDTFKNAGTLGILMPIGMAYYAMTDTIKFINK